MAKLFNPFETQYWMVTGRWFEVVTLGSENGIVGSGKSYLKEVYQTEVISVHPLTHGLRFMLKPELGRRDYAIVDSNPISKAQFDFVIGNNEAQVNNAEGQVETIVQKIEAEHEAANNETQPDSTSEGNQRGEQSTALETQEQTEAGSARGGDDRTGERSEEQSSVLSMQSHLDKNRT